MTDPADHDPPADAPTSFDQPIAAPANAPEETPDDAQRLDPQRLTWARDLVDDMRQQIASVVLGQDRVIQHTLAALLAGGHVLLEGVPGVGKTLLALALARTFDGKFSRVQFTPDLMPSDVTGHSVFKPDTGEFKIRRGPAFTHLLLADEINRAPAKTQAALLEVMQEQQVSIEGQSFRLAGPFMALATQNPLEHEGTYPLPEAQLDRFLIKVLIDYPESVDDEVRIVNSVTVGQTGDQLDVSSVSAVATASDVLNLQDVAAALLVDPRNVDYAVRLVRRTRTWGGLRQGTGTRGAIALVRTARAFALLDGRDFVVPDDIKQAALPVLRHRVAVAPGLQMEGQPVDDVLDALIADVDAPRQ